jgi:hypothetical protein
VLFVNRGPVYWRSKLQPTVALSTAEAEYMAASECAQSVNWLRNMLSDLNCSQTGPTIIWEDSQSCIKMSRNPAGQRRTKHIDIRHHFIIDQCKKGHSVLQYCATNRMIADILTKYVPSKQFAFLRQYLMNEGGVCNDAVSFHGLVMLATSCQAVKKNKCNNCSHCCVVPNRVDDCCFKLSSESNLTNGKTHYRSPGHSPHLCRRLLTSYVLKAATSEAEKFAHFEKSMKKRRTVLMGEN